jgi:hypothetical protein
MRAVSSAVLESPMAGVSDAATGLCLRGKPETGYQGVMAWLCFFPSAPCVVSREEE